MLLLLLRELKVGRDSMEVMESLGIKARREMSAKLDQLENWYNFSIYHHSLL